MQHALPVDRWSDFRLLIGVAWVQACACSTHTEGGASGSECTKSDLARLEADMAAALGAVELDDPSFTVLIETADGRAFRHDRGDFDPGRRFESASTSKWVTAVVLLDLVDQGLLALDTEAMSLLPFWTEPGVTLRHLLSFTSGISQEPLCVHAPNADFYDCVETIHRRNAETRAAPGTEFDYASTHLQVAGAMAIRAAGVADWSAVFDAFQARSGLFANATYELPSAANPRLAGGMVLNADEYLEFLRALYHGDVLATETGAALFAEQRGTARVVDSPVWSALGEDWSYGFGNWLECRTAIEPGSFDCGDGHRNSSPGAYGAYPFIDFDQGYFGVVARESPLGSAADGVKLFRAIEDLAAAWSTRSCNDAP